MMRHEVVEGVKGGPMMRHEVVEGVKGVGWLVIRLGIPELH